MITSYQLFCEAISLSQAKYYTKIWYEKGGNNIHAYFFSKLFKGKPDTKYRLYYPFQMDGVEEKTVDELETDITKILTDNGYSDVDYIGNKTTDKYKRTVKISSVLSKLKETELLNKYNANLNRSNTKSVDEYMIVISRHPVDLAGMSTKRGWTSCMNLKDGSNMKYVEKDIKYGTLIAYIIKSTDLNIQKPIARCLIKPFINYDTTRYKIYLPEKRIYGTLSIETHENFLEFIDTWCEDNLNKDIIDGKYYKHDNLYNDGGLDTMFRITSLRKYLVDRYGITDDLKVIVRGDLILMNTNIKSLDTSGLKVIVHGDLNVDNNELLSSIKGLENFDVRGNIFINWYNITDITLREIILIQFKSYITRIDENTIQINNNLGLTNMGLTSLDTNGLKVIVTGFLNLFDNPKLTSLKGIENFKVKGDILIDFRQINDATLRDKILYTYNRTIKWIDDNTISIDGDLDFNGYNLTSLDTDGLKVIVNHNLDLRDNPLTSLDGIENFDIKGNCTADWKYIKGITIKDIILYNYKRKITWIDDNTIQVNGTLFLMNNGLTSLDTGGLKVIVTEDLYLRDNPLTSLDGIENFVVKGMTIQNFNI